LSVAALDQQFQALQQRFATTEPVGQAEINAATDFAIDANAAGRSDLSIALLEPLAKRAPNVAKVWQLLALAWREEQEMAKAEAAYAKAAALAPQDPRIALGVAQVRFETGLPAAALFQKVRAVAPRDGELALSTANALVQEGRGEAGEALLAGLLRQNPGWLRGLDALSMMHWLAGDQDRFDRSYADVVRNYPQDLNLRLAWYRAVSQVGLWDRATAIIEDGRAIFGDRIEFDATEAHLAAETGDFARADALFAKAASLEDQGTAISHIRHLLRTGRAEAAEAVARPWLQRPGVAMLWPYMSTIWRLTGNDRAGWLDGDPPFIRHYDLPVADGQLDALADLLRGLHMAKHHPPEQSLRGGTQTQGHLFLRLEPELLAIRALILAAVRDYVDALPPYAEGHPLLGTPRAALHFQGAWSVRLSGQGFHVVHTHPHGWISSALYVALPQHMGEAKAGWLQLGAPPPDLRLDLPPYAEIEPKPGRLALFPSTMWHGTIAFDDGERLTIAFDMRTPSR
jgi:thioredoxin-like negative regulator of GroEL